MESITDPQILITGTGALACLFAARLAKVGVPIIMLGTWPEGLRALRQKGVILVQPNKQEEVFAVQVLENPSLLPSVRFALVLVKAWQTKRAAKQLAACLPPDALAVTLQNGLGNHQILLEALGAERAAVGITTTGATLIEPGRVRVGGEGVISIGTHTHLGELPTLLEKATFQVKVLPDVDALLWTKLVINAAINPLTALLEIPNGRLLQSEKARLLYTQLANETAAVAAAKNIRLSFSDPVKAVEDVAQKTAKNISSMLQDIRRGAPTEIDAICGAVVQEAQPLKIPTPINQTMWNLIKAKAELTVINN
jgi:2-dehydropantoate 2-reductase